MGIPKKTRTTPNHNAQQAASDSLLTSKPSADSATRETATARDILPTRTTSKTKLTLTMDAALKRRLKAAAAAQDTTVSDLVEKWATTWLDASTTPS